MRFNAVPARSMLRHPTGAHRPGRRPAILIAAALSAVALVATALATATPATASRTAAAKLPPIRHVWLIDLENEGFAQTVGDPRADPYLAKTVPAEGALLTRYYATGHDSADNYISQISGQAPTYDTQNDCGIWVPFPKSAFVLKPYHQLVGNGCVYPKSIQTLGNQLTAARLSWKAYLQDMGNDPARDHTTATAEGPACGHPGVGKPDNTESSTPGDQYVSRHDGFMYFESVIANRAYCEQHVVSFQPLLKDLSSAKTTPNFSFVGPNVCMDGHDAPCSNGDPGGLAEIDAFLQIWLPEIIHSPAYQQNGLIIVTFDEGSTDAACCGETRGRSPSHPDVALPGMGGPGGGRVETVLISKYIKPGTVSAAPYNHYSTLRSIEDLFHLSHLGDAAQPQVHAFGSDVYTAS